MFFGVRVIYTLKTHKIAPAKLDKAVLHYNPTLAKIGKRLYTIYRCQNSLQTGSWLAASGIDNDYRVRWTKRLQTAMRVAEDPRAVVVNGFVHVFYQTGELTSIDLLPHAYTIRCARYTPDFELVDDTPLKWRGRQTCEKNWCPFYDEMTQEWYCVYSVNPWRVLKFNEGWEGELIYEQDHKLPWSWGQIRGGACPVRVLPPVGVFMRGAMTSQYWAWFHSSFMPPKCTKMPRQYVGGLLSFNAEPPFAPTGISTFPLITPDLSTKTVVAANVSYPSGAILENGVWTVSVGYGDCQVRIITLSHDEVINSANFRRVENAICDIV